jgi:hypothetical protein
MSDTALTDDIDARMAAIEAGIHADLEAQQAERQKANRRLLQRQESAAIGNAVETADPLRIQHTSLREMLERFIFVATSSTVVIQPTAEEAACGNRALAVPWRNLVPMFAQSRSVIVRGAREQATPNTQRWLHDEDRITVAHMGMAIGRPRIYDAEDGSKAVNLWTPRPRRASEPDDREHIAAFLGHIEYLLPIEEERERFLDWLAHCEQRPEELPHHGWLFWTEAYGVGRNWLAAVLARVWRGEVAASLDLAALIDSGFNGRIAGKRMAIVDEIHLNDSGRARYATEAKLRQMMTAETRRINQKYGAEYDEQNCCRWLLFSNHADALPMPEEDRRFAVAQNPSEPRPPDYYAALYQRLKAPQFLEAVGAWLSERDVSRFNPGAKPPMNAAKRLVIESTKPQLDRNLAELIDEWPWPVAAGSDLVTALGLDPHNNKDTAHFGMAMKRAKHALLDGRPTLPGGERVRVWLLAGRQPPEDVVSTVVGYRRSPDLAALMQRRAPRF